MEREARQDIAEMSGTTALPRRSGELVFHEEWERRAFAIAVALAENGQYKWHQFQQGLIAAIAEAERDDPLNPSRDYFESWLAALEEILAAKGILPATGATKTRPARP